MIGRLLHDDVARFEVHRAGVEHHVYLARHDDRIIHRAGTMRQRIARRRRVSVRRRRPPSSWYPSGVVDLGTDRRKVDDQQVAAAVLW